MTIKSIYKSPAGEQEIMAFYDSILAGWPVSNDHITVPTRHGNTFIIASGSKDAPPLILLHGSCSNALSWIGDVPEYSRHFRVYAVDTPGEPGRSAQNRPSWNSPAYAEWMQDLLDYLKIRKVILVGLSQGGWTALKFAVYRPERVQKLVLLAPAGIVPDRPSFLLRAVFFSLLGRRGAESLNRFTMGGEPVHPTAVKYMNTIMTHFRPRIDSLKSFTDEELKRLDMPVMLISGKLDPIRSGEKIAARLQIFLPDLSFKLYPEKGHVLVNLAGEISRFLLRSG
jgi:pimeloyl-ACP methyl ester carboxylesterase